jgi:hypothetical protein
MRIALDIKALWRDLQLVVAWVVIFGLVGGVLSAAFRFR